MSKKGKGYKVAPLSDHEEGIAKSLDAAEGRNAELTKKVESLLAEVYRLEGVVRQANSDRDNWRRQALEENARLEAVLSCIRRYAEAEKAEAIAADESLKAYNRKQTAFRELLLCQTAEGGGK